MSPRAATALLYMCHSARKRSRIGELSCDTDAFFLSTPITGYLQRLSHPSGRSARGGALAAAPEEQLVGGSPKRSPADRGIRGAIGFEAYSRCLQA